MPAGKSLAMLAGAAAPVLLAAGGKLLQPAPEPVPTATPMPAPSPVPVPTPSPTPSPTDGAPPGTEATPVAEATPAPPPPLPPILAEGDPAACMARYAAISLPYQRGAEPASKQVLVCTRGYLLSFNRETCDPDWVLERLTPFELSGTAKRNDKFRPDPRLEQCRTVLADYKGSGYDRGHQAPAGDAKFDQSVMDDSFFMTNMAPQVGIGFNRGAWKHLEETVRAWVRCGGHEDLYVLTGPIYGERAPTLGANRISIPGSFYKIVYDPGITRAVAFVLPNAKIGSRLDDLQAWVKPIAEVETGTGLNFFPNWTYRQQRQLKTRAGTAWGHVGDCPGDTGD